MRRLGTVFLLFFFGLTHVLSAANTYADMAGSSDYISDAEYLEFINSDAATSIQKCCLKRVIDDVQQNTACQNDVKFFSNSHLAFALPKATCISLVQIIKTPDELTSEFLRPPIS